MINSHSIRTLSELLTDLRDHVTEENVSVATIQEAFHERGFGFFLFLLGLPAAVPIPAMGMHTVISIPMLLLTFQQMMGFHKIWMPDIIRKRTIKRETLVNIIDHCLPWAHKLEKVTKPRMGYITHGYFSNLIGLLGFIQVACIAVPLPLTNTVPAIGIILMSAGVLTRDGLAVLLGAVIGTVWSLAWFVAFVILGTKGLEQIMGMLTSFI